MNLGKTPDRNFIFAIPINVSFTEFKIPKNPGIQPKHHFRRMSTYNVPSSEHNPTGGSRVWNIDNLIEQIGSSSRSRESCWWLLWFSFSVTVKPWIHGPIGPIPEWSSHFRKPTNSLLLVSGALQFMQQKYRAPPGCSRKTTPISKKIRISAKKNNFSICMY